MKYIVKYYNPYNSRPMYMIAYRKWTGNITEATTHDHNVGAINLVKIQYPRTDSRRNHIAILKYTDKEYFKMRLKG